MRRRRKENDLNCSVPQRVGQMSVICRLADIPVSVDRQSTEPLRFHFQKLTLRQDKLGQLLVNRHSCFGRPTANRASVRFLFQNGESPGWDQSVSLRLAYRHHLDQPIGDRELTEFQDGLILCDVLGKRKPEHVERLMSWYCALELEIPNNIGAPSYL